MTLFDLQQGEKGIITKVRGRGAFRNRIMEMGFVAGKEIIVGKKAPLKNPIEYTVMGYNVSLRNSEAKLIEVVKPEEGIFIEIENGYNGVIIDDTLKKKTGIKSKVINIALVGNPNSGKTTLFNYASHSRERVGNYGGVTVDAKQAKFKHNGYTFNIIDLPGTYSITSYTPEELFVRDYLFKEIPDVVVNVIDSSNLERNLYLTTQLIDLDIKLVIALNMFDELQAKGDEFDYESLGKMIGIPMVPTVSSKGKGIKELFDKIIDVFEDRDPTVRHIHINYGRDIENSIKKIQDKIRIEENKKLTIIVAPRFLAIKLLEKDREEEKRIRSCINYEEISETVKDEIKKIESQYSDTTETIITDHKYGFIEGALKETYKVSKLSKKTSSSRIDRILTHKIFSYPIFILFMLLMFQSTFLLGAYPKAWIENLMTFSGSLFYNILPDCLFRDLLVNGIIGGVGGVIVFLPNILILFFFISIMEDTGYMPRVAFIVDKIMHKIGLHGRSFIPMLMGFGCNVPAILATRTIGGKNNRLVTMLINPFMSCSARLTVYILIIGTFFPDNPGLMLFLIYGIGILLSIIVAIIFKKTLFKSKDIPFVMELPPYRMPTVKSILRHTWFNGSIYLKKMGGVILIASIIIWALGYFPRSHEINSHYEKMIVQKKSEFEKKIIAIDKTDSIAYQNIITDKEKIINDLKNEKESKLLENSMIGKIGHFIEPAIRPLGFDSKIGVSLVAGVVAKEIVVSTLGVLYQTNETEYNTKKLSEKLKLQTYEYGKRKGEKVYTRIVAFGFLLFILIYFPCIAVIAAIKKESGGWKWAIFMALYSTSLAWIITFLFYQISSLI